MIAKDLAAKLMENPDAEVTVQVWDGDWSDENEIESVIDWGSFVSIQHGRRR